MEIFEAILNSSVLWLKTGAEAVSAVLVGAGMLLAVYQIVRLGEAPSRQGYLKVRLTMARFLVLALEFQLAADILGTAVSPTWEQLGRLSLIAVIRTFLAYFLEREMKDSEQEMKRALAD